MIVWGYWNIIAIALIRVAKFAEDCIFICFILLIREWLNRKNQQQQKINRFAALLVTQKFFLFTDTRNNLQRFLSTGSSKFNIDFGNCFSYQNSNFIFEFRFIWEHKFPVELLMNYGFDLNGLDLKWLLDTLSQELKPELALKALTGDSVELWLKSFKPFITLIAQTAI